MNPLHILCDGLLGTMVHGDALSPFCQSLGQIQETEASDIKVIQQFRTVDLTQILTTTDVLKVCHEDEKVEIAVFLLYTRWFLLYISKYSDN